MSIGFFSILAESTSAVVLVFDSELRLPSVNNVGTSCFFSFFLF